MSDPTRILTTHCGSLPRPRDLLDAMKAKLAGQPTDAAQYEAIVAGAIDETVRKQAQSGLDILADGELSKPGFFTYVRQRLSGFEARPGAVADLFPAEVAAFPEYYAEYFKRAMGGGGVAPTSPVFCVGPVSYKGADAIQADLARLKASLTNVPHEAAFVPAVAPSGCGKNEYYKSEEEFFHAVGEALREEYLAIVAAGFQLQVDDPFLCDIYADPALDRKGRNKRAAMYVEAINHSIRGIPEENIRFHTCYGINEGPRIHEAALADVVNHMLAVKAGAYSFEAANCRHEHEYHLWESVKLPKGRKIIPGVITHASNIVEHPELIAERLVRFAERVGKENVVAGADCGFSFQASYTTEVHPTVIWEKFKAMAEGARLASAKLW